MTDEILSDSERLRILLDHRGCIERAIVSEGLSRQHKRTVDDIDAMALALGFEIDWQHDPRDLDQIIRDEFAKQMSSREPSRLGILTRARSVMLEQVQHLRLLASYENKVWKALRGS